MHRLLNAGEADTAQYDSIVPETILNKYWEYAKPELVLRGLAAYNIPASEIKGSDIDIPIQTSATIDIHTVAEGAEILKEFQTVTSRNLRPVKYADAFYVTKEATEDCIFSVVDMNSKASAERMARNEEYLIATLLGTYAGNTASGTTSVDIDNLREAKLDLTKNDFKPTDLILSPQLVNDLEGIDTYMEADKSGVNNPTNGLVGRIMGMKVWEGSTVINESGKYTGYMIDRNNAFVIGEKRPLKMETFENPKYDRTEYYFSMRTAMAYLHTNAIAKIDITP